MYCKAGLLMRLVYCGEMPMKKGIKTSELWVVMAVLVPWILNQLGIDTASIIKDADQLREAQLAIAKHLNDTGKGPTLFGIGYDKYVSTDASSFTDVGRTALLKAMKRLPPKRKKTGQAARNNGKNISPASTPLAQNIAKYTK